MTMLVNLAITGAVSALVSTPLQLRDGPAETFGLQANFAYGSGGTSATAWVQTSYDDGLTWCDVACFGFTTSNGRTLVNVSALTAITTPASATDGSLSSNSATNGIMGALWRTKVTTVGTYAASTTLRIDAQPNRGRLTQR